ITCVRDTYTFNYPNPPAELVAAFRNYYGPTMNAFEAAEKNGRAADLQKELVALFESQNRSPTRGTTSIPATFLRVTVRAGTRPVSTDFTDVYSVSALNRHHSPPRTV